MTRDARSGHPWRSTTLGHVALLQLCFDAVASLLFGYIPERQPWRFIVAAVYGLLALAGAALIVWLVIAAL